MIKFECNCGMCYNNLYRYSSKLDMAFIEIPKNGSMTLKKSGYIPTQLNKINDDDILNIGKSFLIFRNPLERFKSLLSHYFIDGSRRDKGIAWFRKYVNNVGYNSTNIANYVIENWRHLGKIAEPHHFNSQVSFIPDVFWETDYKIYGMDYLNKLTHKKINTSSSNSIYISDNNLEFLHDVYREDFGFFKKYLNRK